MPGGGYVPVPLDLGLEEVDLPSDAGGHTQGTESSSRPPSVLSLEYFRKYFDVDTHQVVHRLLSGLIPFSRRFSLSASLRPVPDLYGPFWVITTLIFSIAFSGSIYEYIISNDASALSTFNFSRVTISAAILFVYWCLAPALLTFLIWFRRRDASSATNEGGEQDFTFGSLFSEMLAIYGYSMVTFIPATMLLCIPISFLQWASIGAACLLSLCVLGSTAWSTFKQRRKRLAIGFLALIIVAHVATTASISVVFFHHPPLGPQSNPSLVEQRVDPEIPDVKPQDPSRLGSAGEAGKDDVQFRGPPQQQ